MSKLSAVQGFFPAHNQKVREKLTDEKFKNFSNLENDQKRIQFLLECDGVFDIDISCDKPSGKTIEKALELKNLGNKAFQSGNWRAASLLYTKSYIYTPSENEKELSIILANRSAALYHLQDMTNALKDIDMSLELHYPADMIHKLMERRARCHLALKSHKAALDAFRDTLTHLDNSKLSLEKRQKLQRDVQIMIGILTKNMDLNIEKKTAEKPTKLADLPSIPKNKIYVGASEVIDIQSNEIEGRFGVASRDIQVGDVLIVEQPYCFALLQEFCQSHCQNCFSKVTAPISCPNCVNVVFCSLNCRNIANNSYHKWECKVLPLIWASGASITCHMALRAISQKQLQYFLDIKDELNKDIKGQYKSCDYQAAYKMVCHENTRNFEDFFHRTNMAVFFMNCLKRTGYFDEFESLENETYIGGLILHNLQLMQFNCHEIAELQKKDSKDLGESVFLGGGLYPTLALLNHSCDPGVVRYFKGTAVVARAVKNIPKGQQVCENYGPIFTQAERIERQKTLQSQYWFHCQCTACLENWPTLAEMDDTVIRFRCDSESDCKNVIPIKHESADFMIQCSSCKQFTNILKGLKALQDTDALFKVARRLQDGSDYKKALEKYIEILKLLDETLAPPFKDFHLCQQGIRVCMLTLGNINVLQ